MTRPKVPPELGPGGRRLWLSVTNSYDLAEHETRLLLEASRCADQLDALAAAVVTSGPVLADGKVNPALVESRQLRLVLARLIASLRLPADEDEPEGRPQRRSGARGNYAGRTPS